MYGVRGMEMKIFVSSTRSFWLRSQLFDISWYGSLGYRESVFSNLVSCARSDLDSRELAEEEGYLCWCIMYEDSTKDVNHLLCILDNISFVVGNYEIVWTWVSDENTVKETMLNMGCCSARTYMDYVERKVGELCGSKDFVYLRNSPLSLISSWCSHEDVHNIGCLF